MGHCSQHTVSDEPAAAHIKEGPGVPSLWAALFFNLMYSTCVDRDSYTSRVSRRYQAVSTHWNGFTEICVVGIATRLRAAQLKNNFGSIPGRDIIVSLSSMCRDGFCGSPASNSMGTEGTFPRNVKLTTYLALVPG
jgi:hypothetical protein